MHNTLKIIVNRIWHELLDGSRCTSPWIVPPIRGLLAHEMAGGHTHRVHVGMSVDELIDRLSTNSKIPTASTFWNVDSAAASVSYLTSTNTLKIIDWACTSNGRARLEIRGVIPVRTSVGYAVVRGSAGITLCNKARMVLVKDRGHDFFILTAFPEPANP